MPSNVSKRLKFYITNEFRYKIPVTVSHKIVNSAVTNIVSMKRPCESDFQADLQYLRNFASGSLHPTIQIPNVSSQTALPSLNHTSNYAVNYASNYSTTNTASNVSTAATAATPACVNTVGYGQVVVGQHPQFNQQVLNDDNVLNFFEIRLRHLKVKESSSYTQTNGVFTCHLLLTGQCQNYTTTGTSNTKKGARRDAVRNLICQLGPPSLNVIKFSDLGML